jgi:hypothetical protein
MIASPATGMTPEAFVAYVRERTRPKRALAWFVGRALRLIAFMVASVALGVRLLAAVILLRVPQCHEFPRTRARAVGSVPCIIRRRKHRGLAAWSHAHARAVMERVESMEVAVREGAPLKPPFWSEPSLPLHPGQGRRRRRPFRLRPIDLGRQFHAGRHQRTIGAIWLGKMPGSSGKFPVRSCLVRNQSRIAAWPLVRL